jgi:hypothetical protein
MASQQTVWMFSDWSEVDSETADCLALPFGQIHVVRHRLVGGDRESVEIGEPVSGGGNIFVIGWCGKSQSVSTGYGVPASFTDKAEGFIEQRRISKIRRISRAKFCDECFEHLR